MQVEIIDKVIIIKGDNGQATVTAGSIVGIETAGALGLKVSDGKLIITDDAVPRRGKKKTAGDTPEGEAA